MGHRTFLHSRFLRIPPAWGCIREQPSRGIPYCRALLLRRLLAGAVLVGAWALPAPALAGPGCPAPLPLPVYATRCTGGAVQVIGGGQVRDCPAGERPAHVMAKEITRLVEKLRCKVGDKVVITSGYRSPRHNQYLRAWVASREKGRNTVSATSRHTQGKAVDFYIKGYGHGQLTPIARQLKIWAGKLAKPLRGSLERIWVKIYRKHQGREPDNLHPFPYIHVELRY